jgi:hypothetical protein
MQAAQALQAARRRKRLATHAPAQPLKVGVGRGLVKRWNHGHHQEPTMLRFVRPIFLSFITASALFTGAAQAALPTGTLEYLQRTGTVGASDDIPMWMRFTLSPSSSPLTFSSNPLSGFDPADLPANGLRFDAASGLVVPVPFASIQSAQIQSWYTCNTTFFTGCDAGGEYTFLWGGDEPGFPNPSGRDSYTMNPGDSVEYLLGTLQPRAGSVAPGTYNFLNVGLQLVFRGLDADGVELFGYHGLDTTCPSNTDCVFTRTVLAVPEPGALSLLALPLALLGWRTRRRSAGWRG